MPSFTDRCITVSYYRFFALVFGISGLLCALGGGVFYVMGYDAAPRVLHILTVPLIGAGAVLRIRAFFGTLCENWTVPFQAGMAAGLEKASREQEQGLRPVR